MTRLWHLLSDGLNALGLRGRAVRVKLLALKGDTAAAGARAKRDPGEAAHRERLDELALETEWAFDRLAYFSMVDLVERAAILDIEVPAPPPKGQENDSWRVSRFTKERLLNTHALAELRAKVRAEERERRADFLAWAPAVTGFVTALAGLGGVLIGIMATAVK